MKLTIKKNCNIRGQQRQPGMVLDSEAEGLDKESVEVLIDGGFAAPVDSKRAADGKGRPTGAKDGDKETR